MLIPLLFLFICVAQLTAAVFVRNFELAKVQSEASTRAITHEFQPQDQVITVDAPHRFDSPKLVVTRKEREIPIIVPGLSTLLGGRLLSSVTGVAVLEATP